MLLTASCAQSSRGRKHAYSAYIGARNFFRDPRRPKRQPRVSQSQSQSLCRVSKPMRVILLAAFAGALQRMPRAAPARSLALRSTAVAAVDRTNWETSGRDLILTSADGTSDIVFDAEHAPAGGDPAAIVFLPSLALPKVNAMSSSLRTWCRKNKYSFVVACVEKALS